MKAKHINKVVFTGWFNTSVCLEERKDYFVKIVLWRTTGEIDFKICDENKKKIYKNCGCNLGELYSKLEEVEDNGLAYNLLNLAMEEIIERSY